MLRNILHTCSGLEVTSFRSIAYLFIVRYAPRYKRIGAMSSTIFMYLSYHELIKVFNWGNSQYFDAAWSYLPF